MDDKGRPDRKDEVKKQHGYYGYYDGIPKWIENMTLEELELTIEKEKERLRKVNGEDS